MVPLVLIGTGTQRTCLIFELFKTAWRKVQVGSWLFKQNMCEWYWNYDIWNKQANHSSPSTPSRSQSKEMTFFGLVNFPWQSMGEKQNMKTIFHRLDGNFLVWQTMMLDRPYELMNCPSWISTDLEIEFLAWQLSLGMPQLRIRFHVSHGKKSSCFPLYWLFNREPYNYGLWKSPIYPKQPGALFSLLMCWNMFWNLRFIALNLPSLGSFSIYWHLHTQ